VPIQILGGCPIQVLRWPIQVGPEDFGKGGVEVEPDDSGKGGVGVESEYDL